MDSGPKIAQVAALVGDLARANMLSALMDGRTLAATELVYQTSRHLSVLVQTETPPTILLQQFKKMLPPGRVALAIAFDIAGVCAHLSGDPSQHRSTIDIGEEGNFLDELWYSMGSLSGLPASIADRL